MKLYKDVNYCYTRTCNLQLLDLYTLQKCLHKHVYVLCPFHITCYLMFSIVVCNVFVIYSVDYFYAIN